MLKTWFLRILAGLIIAALVLLLTAPAKLMKNQLTATLPGIQITGTSGQFLAGQFKQLSYQGVNLKNLSWDLSLLSLLSAQLVADLSIEDQLFNGTLSYTQGLSDNISLSNINGLQSILEVSQLWPAIGFASPVGELVWADVSLTLNKQVFTEAEGELQLQNIAITVNGERIPLGNIRISPTISKGDLLLTLTSDRPLDIRGTVRLRRDRTYQLNASLSEQLPENIDATLRLVARPDATGRLQLNIPGRW